MQHPVHTARAPYSREPAPRKRMGRLALWLVGGVLVVAAGTALRAMGSVAVPVLFAILTALVMAPVHAWLEKILPSRLRWVAHLGVMTLLLAIVAIFLGALVFAAERVLQQVPDMSGRLQSLLPGGEGEAPEVLGGPLRDLWGTLSSTLGNRVLEQATALAQSIASMTGVFMTTMVVVFFLVLLVISERGIWRDKLQSLGSGAAAGGWSQAVHTVAIRLRRFLVVRTAVGLLQAALYVGWLAYFGVDLLFVWGVLTFLLTYIPNLGSVIAGTLPVFYVLVTKDGASALGVAAGLLVIEQVVGNYLDPRLLGRQIALSPFVILVGLLFWGWMWGLAGAFLATPIMLSLLVVFNTVPALRPVALILSDQRTPEDLDGALDRS